MQPSDNDSSPADAADAFASHIQSTLGVDELPEFWSMLWRHSPSAMQAYFDMRRPLLDGDGSAGGLPKRVMELLVVALDILQHNTWGVTVHTRAAIAAGATREEIADVVALTVLSAGMVNYRIAGYLALEEAERAFGRPEPGDADASK